MTISLTIPGPTYPDLAAYFKILKFLQPFYLLVESNEAGMPWPSLA